MNQLADDNLMPKHVVLTSWNAGAQVLEPDERVIPDVVRCESRTPAVPEGWVRNEAPEG